MDQDLRRKIEEEASKYEKRYAEASSPKRLWLRLYDFAEKINLTLWFLVPAIIAGLVYTFSFYIGSQFVSPEHHDTLKYICLTIGVIAGLPLTWRNIKLVEFMSDYLHIKDDQDK